MLQQVLGGVLQQNGSFLLSSTGNLLVDAGATYNLNGNSQTFNMLGSVAINGGTVNLVGEIMPPMVKAGRGQIVVFGSIAGYVLAPDLAAYCASKAATNAYVEILMEETRGSGVHVILVCPPMVNTPLLNQATENSNPKNIQMAKATNRLASPEFIIDKVEQLPQKLPELFISLTK